MKYETIKIRTVRVSRYVSRSRYRDTCCSSIKNINRHFFRRGGTSPKSNITYFWGIFFLQEGRTKCGIRSSAAVEGCTRPVLTRTLSLYRTASDKFAILVCLLQLGTHPWWFVLTGGRIIAVHTYIHSFFERGRGCKNNSKYNDSSISSIDILVVPLLRRQSTLVLLYRHVGAV